MWSVLGGIAARTERIRVGTGLTCPTIRMHPAIVAHAAATCAAMLDGRFFLGAGTGENLNEHVTGARWPAPDERLDLLEEALEVLRLLWQGGEQTHRGRHYTVDHARLYTLPEEPIPVAVAAAGPPGGGARGSRRRRAGLDDAGRRARRARDLVREWERAGFDHVAFHQVGSDQSGFFRFWEQELAPRLEG